MVAAGRTHRRGCEEAGLRAPSTARRRYRARRLPRPRRAISTSGVSEDVSACDARVGSRKRPKVEGTHRAYSERSRNGHSFDPSAYGSYRYALFCAARPQEAPASCTKTEPEVVGWNLN